MKLKLFLFLLIFTNTLKGQDNNLSDSLLNQYIIVTTKSYRETRKLAEELSQLNNKIENYANLNSYLNYKLDSLENDIDQLKENRSNLNNTITKEKESSATDWITAIAALIGIPLTILAIRELFKKNRETQITLSNITSIASAQNEINNKFGEQLEELKLQTQHFNENNEILTKRLNIEQQRHEYNTLGYYEELEEYYNEMLISLESSLKKQANILKEMAGELRQAQSKDYSLEVVTDLQIENIDKIDHTSLFRIFILNRMGEKLEKVKAFNKLSRSVKYLKLYLPQIPINLEEFTRRYLQYQDDWKYSLGEIQNFIENAVNYNTVNNIPPCEDPFVARLDRIVSNWLNFKNDPNIENIYDPYFMLKNYIEPIRTLCNEIPDRRTIMILPHIRSCSYAVKQIDHLTESYAERYSKEGSSLEKLWEDIYTSLNYLKGLEKVETFSAGLQNT